MLIKMFIFQIILSKPLVVRPPSFYDFQVLLKFDLILNVTQLIWILFVDC